MDEKKRATSSQYSIGLPVVAIAGNVPVVMVAGC